MGVPWSTTDIHTLFKQPLTHPLTPLAHPSYHRFEHTGEPLPPSGKDHNSLWDNDSSNNDNDRPDLGSLSYRRALSQHALLSSREFTEGFGIGIDREGEGEGGILGNSLQGARGQHSHNKEAAGRSSLEVHLLTHPPNLTQVQVIPSNCPNDEVLQVVKGAMFEVSEWLLVVANINRRRQEAEDRDLEEACGNLSPAPLGDAHHQVGSSNPSDPSPPHLTSPLPHYTMPIARATG